MNLGRPPIQLLCGFFFFNGVTAKCAATSVCSSRYVILGMSSIEDYY